MTLIPGVPAGVSWAVVGIAVVLLLLHGLTTVKGIVAAISKVGKPKPKPVTVGSILG